MLFGALQWSIHTITLTSPPKLNACHNCANNQNHQKKKKKLITVNIFTINEASCFIPDDSDREKLCGYKIIPLINRRPLRHKMLIKQTNLEKFNVHDFDCVAVECNNYSTIKYLDWRTTTCNEKKLALANLDG